MRGKQATSISDGISDTSTVWLMFSMIVLTAFNVLLLLTPPKPLQALLTLMTLPMAARLTLLGMAGGNVVASMTFEQWGAQSVGNLMGVLMRWWQRGHKRGQEGKVYKVVEGGMR